MRPVKIALGFSLVQEVKVCVLDDEFPQQTHRMRDEGNITAHNSTKTLNLATLVNDIRASLATGNTPAELQHIENKPLYISC